MDMTGNQTSDGRYPQAYLYLYETLELRVFEAFSLMAGAPSPPLSFPSSYHEDLL